MLMIHALLLASILWRMGATGWQLRYSDDEQPVVWIAVARRTAAPLGVTRRRAASSAAMIHARAPAERSGSAVMGQT
jgi:hypothetical protein